MQRIIEELLDGEKCRTENIGRSEEYKKQLKQVDKVYQKFLGVLSNEQKIMLEELYNELLGLEAEQSKYSYIQGFKLGLRTVLEVFDG